MHLSRSIFTISVVLALSPFSVAVSLAQSRTPEIWLAPLQPIIGTDGGRWGAVDYFDLFDPAASWPTVSKAVKVFKIYPSLINGASDTELTRLWRGLSARHIKLALEANGLYDLADCTPGLAKGKDFTAAMVARLKRLGVQLSYVAMNGPLVSGHRETRPGSCRADIKSLAADSAKAMHKLIAIFPDLKIGDIESIGAPPADTDWRELAQWLDAFKVEAGFPLAFVHIDVTWGIAWQSDLIKIAAVVRGAGVALGVIYDGDTSELSDADWAKDVELHYTAVEALLGKQIEDVIFQSWAAYPHKVLPENVGTTETGIITRYLRTQTILARLSQNRVRLTDAHGGPIARAEIVAEEAHIGFGAALVDQRIDGEVPHDVTQALFALRVNTECQSASTPTRMSIVDFHFRQPEALTYQSDLRAWGAQWRGVTGLDRGVVHIAAAPDQKLVLNGPAFPVVSDAPFEASFKWNVDADTGNTGCAAIIFQDAGGRERHRTSYPIASTWRSMLQMMTDADGAATIPARELSADSERRFRFAGDAWNRPTELLDTERQ